MNHLAKMLAESRAYAQERDLKNLLPLEMLIMYIISIIEGDRASELEFGSFLDRHSRRGWDFVGE
jgi:hypothetical protein